MPDAVVRLPTEAAPPASSAVRMALERVQGASLVGWALDPAAPGQEQLSVRCGEQLLSGVVVRRVPRDDVRHALAVEASAALGFELTLPVDVWPALVASQGSLQVLVNEVALSHATLRPTLSGLMEWMDRIGHQAALAQRETLLGPLREHLLAARQCQAALAALGAEGSAMSGPVAGHVEGWRGLVLRGWVADTPDARVPIRLRVGEQQLEAAVRRISRHDVAKTLMLAHEEIGFELEVPGSAWQRAGDAPALLLQVVVDGVACGEPQRLSRDSLSDRLDAALAGTDPVEREHQALLALEHLVHAQALDTLDAPLMSALSGVAEAAGAGPFLQRRGAIEPETTGHHRKPARLGPRGRLGQWLQLPANAERALGWLKALRARPALSRVAESVEVALTLALGWFDKALYDDQVPPARRGGLSALRHYVREGDAQSLVPMALFDPRHYTGQLPGRRHPGINRLLHHALWGRFHGLSISDWFDGAYYLEHNADVRAGGHDPLLHFMNWGWREHRRPHPDFQPLHASGGHLLQRLTRGQRSHHPDPRVDFLLDGLPASVERPADGRLPWMPPTHLDGRNYLALAAWRGLPVPDAAAAQVVVLVPVYAGIQETLRCLWSVLDAEGQTPFELVVVDDCSPDPALSAFLRELVRLGLIRLLVNEQNQGFVASVNGGLSLHWDRDVVILNADTRVHAGWLDRLVAHGRAEPRAASVTPMSNHATICSYPSMPRGNPQPVDPDDAELDHLAARANRGRHVEAPTGVGFCMWMRRTALDAVGLLDTERFGRGYGEENDWCQRARAAGWMNLIAGDVYVLHQGSVSFSGETSSRVRAAMLTLAERYPDYANQVDAWIAADPMRPLRARLDLARLHQRTGHRVVLMISHARGGGTARHEAEQAERLRAEQGIGTVFLRPSRRPGRVSLVGSDGFALPNLDGLPPTADGLLAELLGMFELVQVQLHHLADHPPALRDQLPALCARLKAPLSVTVHDYHAICPRINLVDGSGRYCGEPDLIGCRRCLQRDAAGRAAGGIVSWRAGHERLLRAANEVIVPDADVAARLLRHVPGLEIQVRPHEPEPPPPSASEPPGGPVHEVLVIGALNQAKGYDVVLGLANAPATRALGGHLTLLGHSSDDSALRDAGVTVLGRYDDATLADRIAALKPDLILLPSVWPETYCYVLTQAMASGCRVAVFDLGAPSRRLRAWDPTRRRRRLLPLDEAAHPELLARRVFASG